MARGGLATSGDYERFFVKDGHRYCHILNPLTGWPVTYWQSISVLAANTTAAGALSTIAMLKGPDALKWLDDQEARFLAVAQDGLVVHSGSADEPHTGATVSAPLNIEPHPARMPTPALSV